MERMKCPSDSYKLACFLQARSTPMGAGSVPMVGGQMSSYGGAFGSQKIATPKELVKMLDQYVVGQTHAKKACCHTLHFEGQPTVTAAFPCTRQPVFYGASQGLYTQKSPLPK